MDKIEFNEAGEHNIWQSLLGDRLFIVHIFTKDSEKTICGIPVNALSLNNPYPKSQEVCKACWNS